MMIDEGSNNVLSQLFVAFVESCEAVLKLWYLINRLSASCEGKNPKLGHAAGRADDTTNICLLTAVGFDREEIVR